METQPVYNKTVLEQKSRNRDFSVGWAVHSHKQMLVETIEEHEGVFTTVNIPRVQRVRKDQKKIPRLRQRRPPLTFGTPGAESSFF